MRYKEFTVTSFAIVAMAVVLLINPENVVAQHVSQGDTAVEVIRISPQEAYQQVTSAGALLVCAYQDEQGCKDILLEGAITLKAFEQRLPTIKTNQMIIFYCQ